MSSTPPSSAIELNNALERFDEFASRKAVTMGRLDILKAEIKSYNEVVAKSRSEDSECAREKAKRAAAFRPNNIGLREYTLATKRFVLGCCKCCRRHNRHYVNLG
jgi:hypothetical protein